MSARATERKTLFAVGFLIVMLVLVILAASSLGSERLPISKTFCALTTFGSNRCSLGADDYSILFDIRLPRILLGAAVGASLAAAGASYQALLRNPLAEPYLLGISNGAAVGTMLALVFFTTFVWTRPVLAFVGAAAASLVVYRLARGRTGTSPER